MRSLFIQLAVFFLLLGNAFSAVDPSILETLDGSNEKDTSVTNKPPAKVEGEEPKDNEGEKPGGGEQQEGNAPNDKPIAPVEGESGEGEGDPEALPDVGEPDLSKPEVEAGAGEGEESEEEKTGGAGVEKPEMPPPPEGEEGSGAPGLPTDEEQEPAPYIPSEKLGAGKAVDFPVDI